MFAHLCSAVMCVLIPTLCAALGVLLSVCYSVLHVVGLMSKSIGAVYMKHVLMNVFYNCAPMNGCILSVFVDLSDFIN